MPTRSDRRLILPLMLTLLAPPLPAAAGGDATSHPPTVTRISLALIHSSGDYGLESESRMQATVLKLSQQRGRTRFRVSLPYLQIDGTTASLYEDLTTGELVWLPDGHERRSGMGDLVFSLERTAWEKQDRGRRINLGGSLKLPTGDEEQGLGSGAIDTSLFARMRLATGSHLISGLIGYQIRGDTDFTDYDNPWFAAVNSQHLINRNWNAGLGARFKQAALPENDDQKSIHAFISYRLDRRWNLTLSLQRGLSDSVADTALGTQITYRSMHR